MNVTQLGIIQSISKSEGRSIWNFGHTNSVYDNFPLAQEPSYEIRNIET